MTLRPVYVGTGAVLLGVLVVRFAYEQYEEKHLSSIEREKAALASDDLSSLKKYVDGDRLSFEIRFADAERDVSAAKRAAQTNRDQRLGLTLEVYLDDIRSLRNANTMAKDNERLRGQGLEVASQALDTKLVQSAEDMVASSQRIVEQELR